MKILLSVLIVLFLFAFSVERAGALTAGKIEDADLASAPIDADCKNLIILIHGWNPDGRIKNKFIDDFWQSLLLALKGVVADPEWRVVAYDWTQDASTGFIIGDGGLALDNANLAAEHAVLHGAALGNLLTELKDLRQVHFVAHSAGAWTAATAEATLMFKNRFVVTQMTLLDAFVPHDADTDNYMDRSGLAITPTLQAFSERVHRFDNYFTKDLITMGTEPAFQWRPGIDLGGVRIDPGPNCYNANPANYLDAHSQPIKFYADTVNAAHGIPVGCLASIPPYGPQDLGWYKSLYHQRAVRPGFSVDLPSTIQGVTGQTFSLGVMAPRALEYQWYLNGSPIRGATSDRYSKTAADADSGRYVVRISNSYGVLFSRSCTVNVTDAAADPPLTLLSVTPASFTGTVQQLSLTGTNFPSTCFTYPA